MPILDTLIIIPARLASSRFPNKPLHPILGQSMLSHCWHRACISVGNENVWIATPDAAIKDHASTLGARCVLTSQHQRATDRAAEALELVTVLTTRNTDLVVMFQGDEPSILPEDINRLIDAFDDPDVGMASLMSPIVSEKILRDINNVKVVTDKQDRAIYFSRAAIPENWRQRLFQAWLHVGVVGFRPADLIWYNQHNQGPLETIEDIDMLRVVENGRTCIMVPTGYPTIGVDTLQEAEIAADIIRNQAVTARYM